MMTENMGELLTAEGPALGEHIRRRERSAALPGDLWSRGAMTT
jgi:hypothetical protein